MSSNQASSGQRKATTAGQAAASTRRSFRLGTMVSRSLRHSWRVSVSVALGVATATAVIVGALLVGDSMRGSLRALTVERLGRTDSVLAPAAFFDHQTVIASDVDTASLIFFPTGVAESNPASGQPIKRAGSVQLIGCDEDFWSFAIDQTLPRTLPHDSGVVLNQAAASALGVGLGDTVTLRLPVEQAVPADSPLGRSDIQSEGLPRMEVLDIIADSGLGRFALTPSQAAPLNVYLDRETVAEVLDRQNQANLVLFAGPASRADLHLDLPALGLNLRRIRTVFPESQQNESTDQEVVFDYYSLTSDRLLLPESAVDRVVDFVGANRTTKVLTYLANAIEKVDDSGAVIASVPYSTISAIDSTDALPLNYQLPESSASADAIESAVPLVINDWTAKQLGAEVGTPLRVAYYEPEVQQGLEVERYFSAMVTDIVPITPPARSFRRSRPAVFDKPPTVYNDPDLTPVVPGVTDQDSISDWELPFQLSRTISSEDDQYWNNYRLTPKAFLPLAEGQRLFSSRFGQTTGLRIEVEPTESQEQLEQKILSAIEPDLESLGWSVQPIRQNQLTASRGTTPFDALFLSLSFFVILSAVMLIAMLFRLGLTERLRQLGTLLAVGWTPKRVATLMLAEGGMVATLGVLLGIAAGIGYAMFVLFALRNWWVGAVTVPFLTFHWTGISLLIGVVSAWLVAMATLVLSLRSILRLDAQTLLSGREQGRNTSGAEKGKKNRSPTRFRFLAMTLTLLAIVVAATGAVAGGQAAAGGFIGGGMLLLFAILIFVHVSLKQPRRVNSKQEIRNYTFGSLAVRSASRNPLRSTLTIGLMATAAFLIISITIFRLRPTEQGTGGFDLIAQTAQPIYRNLSDPQVQSELIGPESSVLRGTRIAPMRMRLGQDASCNNLYQATTPTVLGIPESFSALFSEQSERLPGFAWASVADQAYKTSPWELLSGEHVGNEDDPIPVVIDQNTAMWSLQMQGGVGEVREFEFNPGQVIHFRVVGLLSNTLLQGRLMIGEANFERQFASISGYRQFLIHAGDQSTAEVAAVLEDRLGDVGMDATSTEAVLSSLLAVQNTYLRTFQSLGALGLLLGTIGLAVAQLRGVLERRRELALLQAVGFTRRRLASLVMRETTILLAVGIGCGAFCAILAVLPYGMISGLRPPWLEPLLVVLGIVLFGILTGLIAVRQVVKMPLLQSLR